MSTLRSYFTEILGTFILVFIGTGAVVTAISIGNGLTVQGILLIAFTFGLTLTTLIYSLGPISGAHFNPAVSIAATIAGKLKAKHLIPYIVMQLIGAFIASLFILVITGGVFGLGVNSVGGFGWKSALLTEAILTALFVIIIMRTAGEDHGHAALAIGGFLTVAHLFAIPISGSSLNPARSFGPAVIAGGQALSELWIYFVGPIIGGIFGALIYIAILKPKR